MKSKKGESLITAVIYMAISLVIFASVFMYVLKNTSTTKWSAGEVAIWSVVGIVGISGMILAILKAFGVM